MRPIFPITTLLILFLAISHLKAACPNAKTHLKSVLPTAKNGKYSLFTWGIDLFTSDSLSSSTLSCLEKSGRYSTLGLFLGFPTFAPPPFNPASYSNSTIQSFLSSNLTKELIIYINFNDTSEKVINNYIQTTLAPFLSSKAKINKVWVRPNIDPNCPAVTNYVNCQILPLTSNFQILNTALKGVQNLGFPTGVYMNLGIWYRAFMPNGKPDKVTLRELVDFPILYDDEDYDGITQSYGNYQPIGPWMEPAAKMSGYWYIDQTCCWPGQVVWTKTTTKMDKIADRL